jgi:hypothetical protein
MRRTELVQFERVGPDDQIAVGHVDADRGAIEGPA